MVKFVSSQKYWRDTMCYEKNFKRMSSFYVNEVHLITMLLPYMERKLNEESKIYTVLQNSLEKTVKLIII